MKQAATQLRALTGTPDTGIDENTPLMARLLVPTNTSWVNAPSSFSNIIATIRNAEIETTISAVINSAIHLTETAGAHFHDGLSAAGLSRTTTLALYGEDALVVPPQVQRAARHAEDTANVNRLVFSLNNQNAGVKTRLGSAGTRKEFDTALSMTSWAYAAYVAATRPDTDSRWIHELTYLPPAVATLLIIMLDRHGWEPLIPSVPSAWEGVYKNKVVTTLVALFVKGKEEECYTLTAQIMDGYFKDPLALNQPQEQLNIFIDTATALLDN